MTLQVERVPTLSDNYTYLAYCDQSKAAAVIDAAEADPALVRISELGLNLTSIFSTHHHLDHTAGNPDIAKATGALIYAHADNRGRLPGLTNELREGDTVQIGPHIGRVLEIPAHTMDHIAFYFDDGPLVFCGDTMFAGGCGRLFEGTPELMFEALHKKLGTLPADTRVYCGHEYTEANLGFASEIFPDNLEISERLAAVQETRKGAAADWHDATPAEMTIPTTIEQEQKTNPFLLAPTVEELARVRALKDEW